MGNIIPVSTRVDQQSDAAQGISILTCTGNSVAAKTHGRSPDGSPFTKSFSAGKFFDHEEAVFADLHGLFEIITKVAANPRQYAVRGRLSDDGPKFGKGQVRRTHRRQPGGEPPCFEDTGRAWVMLDFDKVGNLDDLDPTSQEAMAYLRTLLPPEFHDAACVFSLSASAGLTDSGLISGHLWFVFNRPVSNRELKSWLAKYPLDKALFTPTQPHYTARPIFSDGRVDPVDVRNGLLAGGTDVVSVPEIDINRPAQAYQGGSQGLEGALGYEAKMDFLGDGEGGRGCHGVITPAIASYMLRHGPGADREALKADIRQRATTAPWDRDKHPDEYVASEISDDVLDRSIQDWVDKATINDKMTANSIGHLHIYSSPSGNRPPPPYLGKKGHSTVITVSDWPLASPCSAALRYHLAASAWFCATPLPYLYNMARLLWAWACPCSAALRYHLAASTSSSTTPQP